MVERARRALALSAPSAATGAAAARTPLAHPLGVASQESRPWDDAFMTRSVEYMASMPGVEFSADFAKAVVETATALFTSKRLSLLHAEGLSVGAACACRDDRQTCRAHSVCSRKTFTLTKTGLERMVLRPF